MELLVLTLKDGSGWQKRLFFQKASKKDLARLGWMAHRLGENGASREEILQFARSTAKERGWLEVAH